MIYLLLLLVVIAVNAAPAFVPPTWTVLVLFLVKFNLYIPAVILCGVLGATSGRYILNLYITSFAHKIFNQREEKNLEFLGKKIGKTPLSNMIFVFLYSLTPLSTTALFVATGIAKLRVWNVLIGFGIGRCISYTLLLLTTKTLAEDITDLFNGVFSIKNTMTTLISFLFIFAFIFIDWQQLIEEHRIKFNFKIWKWN